MAQPGPERRVLLVHPTGNAFVRHAAFALHSSGMLGSFHTTIAWRPGGPVDRMLPAGLRAEFARRAYTAIPSGLIHAHPLRELVRLLAIRMRWAHLIDREAGLFSFDRVASALDQSVARRIRSGPLPHGIYAYEDCALAAFQQAKRRGTRCLYDLPIGHYRFWRRFMEEERELEPEWAPTLSGMHDSPEKLEKKDREIELADAIFVASSFTAATLGDYPRPIAAPVYRVAYGAPAPGPARMPTDRGSPLRVLFVGQMGQRKGLGYLIKAMDRLEVAATLTLLGRPVAVPPVMKKALGRYRWIESAPNDEVLRLMREHDVLVFPSLFEGFGLVIPEAMAQGTVVIATPHTAAPDLLEDGHDGFIVPVRSADAIAERLTQLAEDRDLLARMSDASRLAASRLSWDEYGRQLVDAIRATLA